MYILMLCIIMSCDNAVEPNDTIDVKSGVLSIDEISSNILEQIANIPELENANIALILRMYNDNIKNRVPEPNSKYIQTFAIYNNINPVEYTKLNNSSLILTNPILFPQYFNTPLNLQGISDFNYNQPINWTYKFENSDEVTIVDSFQTKIHYLFLDTEDTLNLNNNYTMKWNPTNNSNDKLYMSFRWYQSFLDVNNYIDIPGAIISDIGIYIFNPAIFSHFDFPEYGGIQIILTRFRANSTTINSKKIALISIAESSVSLYLAK